MCNQTAIKWLTIGALVLGALCSSALIVYVGWKQEVLGYVAWTLMPYAALAAILLCAHLFCTARSVQLLYAWACIGIALAGPLLYIDAMFVHVDAQGALAVLMIPLIQAALSIVVVVIALLWQWRIGRRVIRPACQTESRTSLPTAKQWRMTGWKKIFISAIIIVALLYTVISMLQSADSSTIKTAKEVDAFITQYCETNNSLPASAVLQSQFPNLNRDSGWFFFTDDKTYLKVQYPMKWWNKDAIGQRMISEFTATVYAYNVAYHCEGYK